MLCKSLAQFGLARLVICGEHPFVEIWRMAKPITARKIRMRSFRFLPLLLWRKQNLFEGIILAYFCPPRVLFFLTQLNKTHYSTVDIDRPNNSQAFWVV